MFLSKPYYTVIRLLKNFRATHFVTNAQDGDTYYCQDNIKHSNTHCIHITSMVTAPLRHSIWGIPNVKLRSLLEFVWNK